MDELGCRTPRLARFLVSLARFGALFDEHPSPSRGSTSFRFRCRKACGFDPRSSHPVVVRFWLAVMLALSATAHAAPLAVYGRGDGVRVVGTRDDLVEVRADDPAALAG